jgi:hypothetical protein
MLFHLFVDNSLWYVEMSPVILVFTYPHTYICKYIHAYIHTYIGTPLRWYFTSETGFTCQSITKKPVLLVSPSDSVMACVDLNLFLHNQASTTRTSPECKTKAKEVRVSAAWGILLLFFFVGKKIMAWKSETILALFASWWIRMLC